MNRREALKLLTALPAVKSIEVANVRPDDVIIIECDHAVSQSTVAQIEHGLGRIWPGRKIVVLDQSMKMRIARHAD